MISPYLCAGSHRDNSLVPAYSAETRPTGKIGCDDCISSLDTVDTFTIGGSDADSPAGVTMSPPPGLRSCGFIGRDPGYRNTCGLLAIVAVLLAKNPGISGYIFQRRVT